MTVQLEVGGGVRWRGQRWRVLGLEGGLARLVGVERVNRDLEITPLLALEGDSIEADRLPLPPLDVEASDRARWRAMHQAYLTSAVGGREQLRGLDWGAVAVEPYQLVPLMRVARTISPRLLIADDTGLGKTAEAGIVLRYLAHRHRAGRILVLTRAAPEPERWRQELWTKFGFGFDLLRSGADFHARRRRSPTLNVFAQQPRLIMSMTLAARQLFLDELRLCPASFDVVVIDEAHHVAQRGRGSKRLWVLAQTLADKLGRDGAMLLLTATPHDGKSESFLSLLRLLDPYVELSDGRVGLEVASRLVVRRLKSEVKPSGGKRFLAAQLHVRSTIPNASRAERALEEPLQAYLDWLREEESRYSDADQRAKAKGCTFLAALLMKRYGSSVAALRATLRRRLGVPPSEEDHDEDSPYVETDASDPEDDIIDPEATAADEPPPLAGREVELAQALLTAAEQVKLGRDAKLEHLSKLLQGDLAGQKVVVFTEYRDSLRAVSRRLKADGVRFVTFHGDTSDQARRDALATFRSDPETLVFLATDAGSEGQNLQHSAHHLVHLEVPWNPNRYEQRNGRIDRYGQTQTPEIWVLVAADRKRGEGRPEFRALELVVEKLGRIQRELGSVSPILPGISGGTVQDVLQTAGHDAEQAVDELMDSDPAGEAGRQLSRLAARNRHEVEQAEEYVSRLGTTDDFRERLEGLLETAFRGWDDGGAVEELGDARLRIRVPARLRGLLGRDEISRATFRRDIAVAEGEVDVQTPAEFLSPGHPLIEAVVNALRDDAVDPSFHHRFDISTAEEEALVLSFLVRFADAAGRTVEERLDAVAIHEDRSVSREGDADFELLGMDGRTASGTADVRAAPDPQAVREWQARYKDVVVTARSEAGRRAEERRRELVRLAQELHEEELSALVLWKREREGQIEAETLALAQVSLEQYETYSKRLLELEAEYEARIQALRAQTDISLASVELIGGRLLVGVST
jgi:superfamily II DNA or RNA helicase